MKNITCTEKKIDSKSMFRNLWSKSSCYCSKIIKRYKQTKKKKWLPIIIWTKWQFAKDLVQNWKYTKDQKILDKKNKMATVNNFILLSKIKIKIIIIKSIYNYIRLNLPKILKFNIIVFSVWWRNKISNPIICKILDLWENNLNFSF